MTKHEKAIEAARAHAEFIGWVPDDESPKERKDTDRQLNEIIAAYNAVMREPAEGEVRVRAVVALDPDGVDYEISGGRADCAQVQRNTARFGLVGEPDACTVQFRWIEATVPGWRPPAEETVEGEVVG